MSPTFLSDRLEMSRIDPAHIDHHGEQDSLYPL